MSAVNGDPAMSGALPPEAPRRLASTTTRSRLLFTVAGLAVIAGAALMLLVTGHTMIRTSADAEAPAVPWVTAVIPVLAGCWGRYPRLPAGCTCRRTVPWPAPVI